MLIHIKNGYIPHRSGIKIIGRGLRPNNNVDVLLKTIKDISITPQIKKRKYIKF